MRRYRTPNAVPVAALLAALLFAAPARAALEAHLYVDRIEDIGRLDTGDGPTNDPLEQPENSEPFWHIAILDVDAESVEDLTGLISIWVDATCADNWDSHLDTLVVDQQFVRPIPPGSEAYFYIGVFDYDIYRTVTPPPRTHSELLGDHYWSGNRDASTIAEVNNNQSCCYFSNADYCELQPTGLGTSNNYDAYFQSWHEDTDGPIAASAMAHQDDIATINDDTVMTFTWTAAQDPHSGVRQLVQLERLSDGANCDVTLPVPGTQSFDFSGSVSCDAGGVMTLDEAESYRARIVAENGLFPTIANPMTATSLWSPWVLQSSQPPTTSIVSPAATGWFNADIIVDVADSANASTCELSTDGGASWSARTCDDTVTVTVGQLGQCNTPGGCLVQVRATASNGLDDVDSRTYSVDWLAEPVDLGMLTVTENPPPSTGATIAPGVWQTDPTPFLVWSDPSAGAPAQHYVRDYALTPPTCVDPSIDASPSFETTAPLVDGQHTFWIRTIDDANNCSTALGVAIRVDQTPDALAPITALPSATAPLEQALTPGVYQIDATPYFTWDLAAASAAPIDGHAVAWGAAPADCDSTQPGNELTIEATAPLPDGLHALFVRAADEAGNCGPAASFLVAVDAQADAMATVEASDPLGGIIADELWQTESLPTFTWSPVDAPGSEREYSWLLDVRGGPDADCAVEGSATSVTVGAPLGNGQHRFSVRAVDALDHCGMPLAVEVWIDTTAESIVGLDAQTDAGSDISDGGLTNDATPQFTWSTTRNAGTESLSRFSVDFDLSDWDDLPCSPDLVNPAFSPAGALSDGPHTFGVRAVDEAGNCGLVATFALVVDTVAPPPSTVTIYDDEDTLNPIGQATWQADRDPYLTWSLDEPEPDLQFSVAVDASADCSALQDEMAFAVPDGALSDGQHDIEIATRDSAGNCSSPLVVPVWVDASGDTIIGLTAYDRDPASGGVPIPDDSPQSDADPYYDWSVNVSGGPRAPVTGYFIGFDEPSDCSAVAGPDAVTPGFQVPVPLADGRYTFAVSARDSAGNCGPEATLDVVVLASGALITVTSVSPNPAPAATEVIIRFDVDRTVPGTPLVTVADGPLATLDSRDGSQFVYRYTTIGTEPEGDSLITVELVDEAGNPGYAEHPFTLDFTPPQLTALTITPAVLAQGDRADISVTSSEPLLRTPEVLVGGVAATSLGGAIDDVWSFTYDVLGTEPEGAALVSVSADDVAGNSASVSGRADFDFTPPAVELTFPYLREVLNLGEEITIRWQTIDDYATRVDVLLSTDGGGSFDTIIAEDIADTGEATWVVAGEATTQARFRVAATDVAGHEGSDSSPFDSRIRTITPDHVLLTASVGRATVGEQVDISVQVVDALGDPTPQTVAIALSVDGDAEIVSTTLTGEDVAGQTVTGTTDTGGTASLSITDPSPELVTVSAAGELPASEPHLEATVRFDPSGPDHLVAFADDGEAPLGGLETVLLQVVDLTGNPTEGAVALSVEVTGSAVIVDSDMAGAAGLGTSMASGTSGADGSALITVRDYVPETVIVTPGSGSPLLEGLAGHEQTAVTFLADGRIDPDASRVVAEPDVLFADDMAISIITVEPRDAAGDLVGSGLDVRVFSSGGNLDEIVDEGDGLYTSALSSPTCPAQPVLVSAEVGDVLLQERAEVQLTCEGVTDAVLLVDPERIPNDGEVCATLSVTPLGAGATPLGPGHAVQFFPSYGKVTPGDPNGTNSYLGSYCSTECVEGTPARINVSVDGVPLTDLNPRFVFDIEVVCVDVDPDASTLIAEPAVALADGEEAVTVTVRAVNTFGHAMGDGLTVVIESTRGQLTQVDDLGDGTYRARLTSSEPGVASLTATINGIELSASADVTFEPVDAAFPGSTALTVEQRLLGGELTPAGNALVSVRIRSSLDYALNDVLLDLTLDPGLELKTDAVRLDEVDVSPDGTSEGRFSIALGRVPARQDATAQQLELRYELRLTAREEGILFASAQARSASDDRSISELSRLSVEITGVPDAGSAEACGCLAQSGRPLDGGGLPLGLVLAALALCRRRPHPHEHQ